MLVPAGTLVWPVFRRGKKMWAGKKVALQVSVPVDAGQVEGIPNISAFSYFTKHALLLSPVIVRIQKRANVPDVHGFITSQFDISR